MFFFFFQAEDGIRDGHVTGVQTCALPIWARRRRNGQERQARRRFQRLRKRQLDQEHAHPSRPFELRRSEERRVGKECRARWAPYNEKKKSSKEGARGIW